MPANLPPVYHEWEKAFRRAKSVGEKLEALQQMMAVMPKHKGTDHLRAELRSRTAKLEDDATRRQGGMRTAIGYVRKDGAGQVSLVGPPNAGKSHLLAALTDASPKVADYPFTTQLPQPAMMRYEDVYVQLVDLPPVTAAGMPPWLRPLLRQADLLLLVLDLADDPLAQMEALLAELREMRIAPVPAFPVGSDAEPAAEGAEAGRREDGVAGEVPGNLGADDQATALEAGPPPFPQRSLVAANKRDLPDADVAWELLQLEYAERLPLFPVSARAGEGLDALRTSIFRALEVVRVYTRAREQKVEEARSADPIILPRGSTVEDVAMNVHKELAARLRFAELWGSGKFAGQRVGREYVVQDGDVIELYT